ncbi:hypothetical protein [Mycolicibacterium sp. S3B2]|uniref:hypothetical protein n=1 Tax=Mycolicibacterium sp. S3B2 TaxID=3415120 RepID=UPI003C7C283C
MSGHETHKTFATAAKRFRERAGNVLSTAAWASENIQRRRQQFVQIFARENEVRFFLEGSRNLGHQAATLELIRGFIGWTKYEGRIVVYFADYHVDPLRTTTQKLRLLLSVDDDVSLEEYVWNIGRAQTIFRDVNRRPSSERPVSFGFSGGADDMDTDFIGLLRVRWFLRVQPYMWEANSHEKDHRFYQCSRIDYKDGRHFYLPDECPNFRELPIHSAPEPSASQRTVQDASTDIVGSLPLLERPLVWPMYCLHNFTAVAPDLLLKLVLLAQQFARATQRKIVLLSFCPTGGDPDCVQYARLLDREVCPRGDMVAELYRLLRRRSTMGASQCLRLSRSVHRLAGSDCRVEICHCNPGIAQRCTCRHLDGTGPSVVYCHPGPVRQDSYRSFLLSSDLPPLIEGQNTANDLVISGKPHVQLFRQRRIISVGYPRPHWHQNETEALPLLDALSADLVRSFEEEEAIEGDSGRGLEAALEASYATLLQFLDPKSPVSRYFSGLCEYYSCSGRDKLYICLLALCALLEHDGRQAFSTPDG